MYENASARAPTTVSEKFARSNSARESRKESECNFSLVASKATSKIRSLKRRWCNARLPHPRQRAEKPHEDTTITRTTRACRRRARDRYENLVEKTLQPLKPVFRSRCAIANRISHILKWCRDKLAWLLSILLFCVITSLQWTERLWECDKVYLRGKKTEWKSTMEQSRVSLCGKY